jgi:hypothetical protein
VLPPPPPLPVPPPPQQRSTTTQRDNNKDNKDNKSKTIRRISNKERDLLKESIARQQRIAVLEKERRRLKNSQQYARRKNDVPAVNMDMMNDIIFSPPEEEEEGNENDEGEGDDNDNDNESSSMTMTTWALLGLGALSAGYLVFSKK